MGVKAKSGSVSGGKFTVVAVGHHFGKVKGEVVGYFNERKVRVGERFQVTEQQFSKKWMARLSDKEHKQHVEEEEDASADAERGEDVL